MINQDNVQIRMVDNSTDLNDKNFILFAAKHYDNSQCHDLDEFHQDLLIPMHLKKLFTRYHVNKDLKERLIINHVVCFFNVFEPIAACKILFYKMDAKYHIYLKTVLHYLNRCPEFITINNQIINIQELEIDFVLLDRLEKMEK